MFRFQWTQQPQYPAQINQSSIFIQNALGGYTSYPEALLRPFDPSHKNIGFFGSTGVYKRITSAGIFTYYGGGGYGTEISSSPVLPYWNDVSVIALFYRASDSSGNLASSTGVSSHNNGIFNLNSDGTISVTANGNVSITTPAVSVGLHLIILTNNRSEAKQKIYIDGINIGTEGTSSAQSGFQTNLHKCGPGWAGGGGIGYTYTIPRILTDNQVAFLSSNPWQIFQP